MKRFLTLCCLIGLYVCQSTAYIQPDKMEDILYDYHIAEAISTDYEIPHDSLTLRAYRHAILEKYGCTDADFDSSLVYYTRHTERLHRIYENLSQRLSNTAISLGASLSDLNRYGSLSATGDTANIWNGDMSFVLMHHPAFNKYSFKIDADSTFHPGDKLQLHFNEHRDLHGDEARRNGSQDRETRTQLSTLLENRQARALLSPRFMVYPFYRQERAHGGTQQDYQLATRVNGYG